MNLLGALLHDYKKLMSNTKKTDTITRTINIIETSYNNPNLSLADIAYELGVSQAHLSREFHSIVGKSYVDYLLATRINHAKKLLSEGVPTKAVMARCGYISDVTFNSAFKRHTGTTPKKYIRHIKNELSKVY